MSVHFVKGGKAFGFVAKGLHHLLAFDHLVDQRGLLAADGALALEVAVAALCQKARHHKAQRGNAHYHQRDGHILPQHEQQGAQNGQDAGEQLGKAHQQAVRKGVHIRHHAADDIAGGVAVQIGQRQGLNFAQRLVAQITADREGDAVVAHAQKPLRKGGYGCHHQNAYCNAQHPGKVYIALAQHLINGVAAQDGDIQLSGYADRRHQQAAHHKGAVRTYFVQHPVQGGLALLRGQLVFCFCTHASASPFLNWLS